MSVYIFPMAGLSSRFYQAGYTKPKFQLMINNESMFEWAVKSFEKYFSTDKFLFIVRGEDEYKEFIEEKIFKLGIAKYRVYFLVDETKGQAETVYKGLSNNLSFIADEGLYIFNIDSKRDSFIEPEWIDNVDGYLELFTGRGHHWSFAKLDDNCNVLKTAEKLRISSFCSDGLYYFKNFNIFNIAYQDQISNSKFEKGEYYIAPLYNHLIENNYVIKGDVIPDSLISFCGTPEEYNQIEIDK